MWFQLSGILEIQVCGDREGLHSLQKLSGDVSLTLHNSSLCQSVWYLCREWYMSGSAGPLMKRWLWEIGATGVALAERDLVQFLLPRFPVFSYVARVPIHLHSLIYISFVIIVGLWNWPNANMWLFVGPLSTLNWYSNLVFVVIIIFHSWLHLWNLFNTGFCKLNWIKG